MFDLLTGIRPIWSNKQLFSIPLLLSFSYSSPSPFSCSFFFFWKLIIVGIGTRHRATVPCLTDCCDMCLYAALSNAQYLMTKSGKNAEPNTTWRIKLKRAMNKRSRKRYSCLTQAIIINFRMALSRAHTSSKAQQSSLIQSTHIRNQAYGGVTIIPQPCYYWSKAGHPVTCPSSNRNRNLPKPLPNGNEIRITE